MTELNVMGGCVCAGLMAVLVVGALVLYAAVARSSQISQISEEEKERRRDDR